MAISFKLVISGYHQISVGEKTNLIAVPDVLSECRQILESGDTLYEYAAKRYSEDSSAILKFKGRGDVFVLPMGISQRRVAVRHSFRGGLIAKLVKDLYIPPTRAIHEVFAASRLKALNIPTPEVAAIAIYKVGSLLRRSDVITRFVEDSADLSTVLSDRRNDAYRNDILDSVALLLARLSAGGVQHEDLNLKNVLISAETSGYVAYLLDVDRAHFHVPNDPMVGIANMNRLFNSIRKWQASEKGQLSTVSESDITYLGNAIIEATKTVAPVLLEDES